jgi:endogenous inhibitor of DNA gyrase (YacG/DUF329 family)
MTPTPKKPKRVFKVICGYCGKIFDAESDRRRWCSDACKMQAYRARKAKRETIPTP